MEWTWFVLSFLPPLPLSPHNFLPLTNEIEYSSNTSVVYWKVDSSLTLLSYWFTRVDHIAHHNRLTDRKVCAEESSKDLPMFKITSTAKRGPVSSLIIWLLETYYIEWEVTQRQITYSNRLWPMLSSCYFQSSSSSTCVPVPLLIINSTSCRYPTKLSTLSLLLVALISQSPSIMSVCIWLHLLSTPRSW